MNPLFELYEIDYRLYELADPETGELLDECAFESLSMERDEKVEGLILWYKNDLSLCEALKKEIDILTDRYKKSARQADRLKDRIGCCLCGNKFSTPRYSVSYRASSSVEIEDTASVIRWAEETGHDDCLSYKPPNILKTALKDVIESGTDVPGAQIISKRNVVIK